MQRNNSYIKFNIFDTKCIFLLRQIPIGQRYRTSKEAALLRQLRKINQVNMSLKADERVLLHQEYAPAHKSVVAMGAKAGYEPQSSKPQSSTADYSAIVSRTGAFSL